MKQSILREFGSYKPRVLVVDDDSRSRTTLRRQLEKRGFDVLLAASAEEFQKQWQPGLFDAIVADWHLSASKKGDELLLHVRGREWSVPFVLISGNLGEATDRSPVLVRMLQQGHATFVERGQNSFVSACDAVENLVEQRDPGLLRLILPLRTGAEKHGVLPTSSGPLRVEDLLADLVRSPELSHQHVRPLTKAWHQKATRKTRD